MRLYIASSLLLLALMGCNQGADQGTNASGSPGRSQTMARNEAPSQRMHEMMMQPMKNMKMSGNADKDFAVMMAEHHQQGVNMAKIELEHGTNLELKAIAQRIMDTQTKESQELIRIAEGLTGTGKSEASNEMHMVMMQPMSGMSMTGDTDKDFAMMMAQHHESAIKMAEIEVRAGKNEQLKAMARKMIDDQKQEKAELERLSR